MINVFGFLSCMHLSIPFSDLLVHTGNECRNNKTFMPFNHLFEIAPKEETPKQMTCNVFPTVYFHLLRINDAIDGCSYYLQNIRNVSKSEISKFESVLVPSIPLSASVDLHNLLMHAIRNETYFQKCQKDINRLFNYFSRFAASPLPASVGVTWSEFRVKEIVSILEKGTTGFLFRLNITEIIKLKKELRENIDDWSEHWNLRFTKIEKFQKVYYRTDLVTKLYACDNEEIGGRSFYDKVLHRYTIAVDHKSLSHLIDLAKEVEEPGSGTVRSGRCGGIISEPLTRLTALYAAAHTVSLTVPEVSWSVVNSTFIHKIRASMDVDALEASLQHYTKKVDRIDRRIPTKCIPLVQSFVEMANAFHQPTKHHHHTHNTSTATPVKSYWENFELCGLSCL